MLRFDKIIKKYQEQLKNKNVKNISKFIQSILDADMTKGKYSRFLLDCFIADKFREEDLKGGLESTIGKTIILFHKHKGKLPEEQRSVYHYDSPGSLWNAVKQFDGELSGKETKKELQDKIYSETEFVYENEELGFKIISPLTKESAQWWGKGTRWCTSADKENAFEEYVDLSPIFIVILSSNNEEKFQFWKHEKDIQFMDSSDNNISLEYIEEHWDIFEPIIQWLKSLKYMPQKFITEEMVKNFLSDLEKEPLDNYNLITYIPDSFIDDDFILNLIKLSNRIVNEEVYSHCSFLLEEVSHEKLIQSCHLEDILFLYPNIASHIPEDFFNKEIVEKFLLKYPNLINKINHLKLLTDEQKIENAFLYYDEKTFPEHLKTEEFFGKLFLKSKSLKNIPKSFITKEMCLDALPENAWEVYYIPNTLKQDDNFMKNVYIILKDYMRKEFEHFIKNGMISEFNYEELIFDHYISLIPPQNLEFQDYKNYTIKNSKIEDYFPKEYYNILNDILLKKGDEKNKEEEFKVSNNRKNIFIDMKKINDFKNHLSTHFESQISFKI